MSLISFFSAHNHMFEPLKMPGVDEKHFVDLIRCFVEIYKNDYQNFELLDSLLEGIYYIAISIVSTADYNILDKNIKEYANESKFSSWDNILFYGLYKITESNKDFHEHIVHSRSRYVLTRYKNIRDTIYSGRLEKTYSDKDSSKKMAVASFQYYNMITLLSKLGRKLNPEKYKNNAKEYCIRKLNNNEYDICNNQFNIKKFVLI